MMDPGDCKVLEVDQGNGKVRIVFSQYNGLNTLKTTKEVIMTRSAWNDLMGQVDPDH